MSENKTENGLLKKLYIQFRKLYGRNPPNPIIKTEIDIENDREWLEKVAEQWNKI